jgi:5-carboxymethyl-2-hydroxymuconate isomerase
MPHLIVEFSANLERQLEMKRVLKAVHDAALATGVFPIGGMRTRAIRHDLYLVADEHADNAFIHVQARIGVGRAPEVRQKAAEAIFAALQNVTADVFKSAPIGLSLEIVEMDPVGAMKANTLHTYVERRATKNAPAGGGA